MHNHKLASSDFIACSHGMSRVTELLKRRHLADRRQGRQPVGPVEMHQVRLQRRPPGRRRLPGIERALEARIDQAQGVAGELRLEIFTSSALKWRRLTVETRGNA